MHTVRTTKNLRSFLNVYGGEKASSSWSDLVQEEGSLYVIIPKLIFDDPSHKRKKIIINNHKNRYRKADKVNH